MNRNFFVRRILMTMAITLLAIIWVFILDGIEDQDWNNLRIVGSIFLFLILYSAADFIICYHVQFNFLLQKVTLLVVFILLFGIIGTLFHWNMPKNHLERVNAMITIVPIYTIWYLIDLRSSRKIATDINKKIQERNQNQEDL